MGKSAQKPLGPGEFRSPSMNQALLNEIHFVPSLVLGSRNTVIYKTDSPLLRDKQEHGGVRMSRDKTGKEHVCVSGQGNGTSFS